MTNRTTDPNRLIPLKALPNLLPKRGGKKIHYSTLYRWATKGARGRRLDTVMIGGIRFASLEALERFIGNPVLETPQEVDDLCGAIDSALDEAGL
ncbi:hypothetical protein Pan181_29570 [Aeoliella mucimassa]|uniref:Uncharacterized protein n=2 Tax=Aeoliella mucimassa TaxID=2527972 RepID=A0A518APV5_9BACT|nr:hypothetical protein Pan181_29570 [Aeoliella mucimassa]